MYLFIAFLLGAAVFRSVSAQTTQLLTITDSQFKVTIPDDLGKAIHDYLDKNEQCKALSRVRSDDRVVDCVEDTARVTMSNQFISENLLALYRGNRIPGELKNIEAVPAFDQDQVNTAFVGVIPTLSSLFQTMLPTITLIEIPFFALVAASIASERTWNHPDTFTNFAVGRRGQMRKSCPAQADIPCRIQLCQSKDGNTCSAFLNPCPCTNNACMANGGQYWCDAECGGMDPRTGLCKGRDEDRRKQQNCPCMNPKSEPHIWPDETAWNDMLQTTRAFFSDPKNKISAPYQICRKKTDEVTKGTEKEWKFVDQQNLDDSIHAICYDKNKFAGPNGKGIDNAAARDIKYTFMSGDLNEMELAISWDSGMVKTPDDCYKEFMMVSVNCDSDTDIHNWKWGGQVIADHITYTATPKINRVPLEGSFTDKSHYFSVWQENGKDDKGNRLQDQRYGMNGKPFDLIQITECIHDIRRQPFPKTLSVAVGSMDVDCAGLITLRFWLGANYNVPENCFQNSYRNLVTKVVNDGAISMESYHQATSNVNCGMQIVKFDQPKNKLG